MEKLDRSDFERLREGAAIIEQDQHGIKVLQLADGTFMKLFRRKRWISKTLFITPASRFANNSYVLQGLGIPSPVIIGLFKMRDPYRSIVHYQPLEGKTLRDLKQKTPENWNATLLQELAMFISKLHDLGVYFRSLHLGNIVLTPGRQLGLIDISDMQCTGRSLRPSLRERNMRHLFRYEKDWSSEDQKMLLSLISEL